MCLKLVEMVLQNKACRPEKSLQRQPRTPVSYRFTIITPNSLKQQFDLQ